MKNMKMKSALALLIVMGSGAAFAGINADFQDAVTTLTDWTTGSLGMLISLAIVTVGLAVGIVKQSIMGVVVGVGAALVLQNAATIITNMFTAVL